MTAAQIGAPLSDYPYPIRLAQEEALRRPQSCQQPVSLRRRPAEMFAAAQWSRYRRGWLRRRPNRRRGVAEGSLVDDGGGVLTAILIAALGAFLLLCAVGVFLMWRRGSAEEPAPAKGRNSRLSVSEAAIVDGQRRLVLVRRDQVEHLLLVGGPSDIVVESNIVRQRATGLAPGQRPAVPRPSEPQAARPVAAAPAATTAERARPVEPDGVAQERLRTASAALAMRQVAAHPAPAGQAAGKEGGMDAPSPGSPAVAGLTAGLAALTAAAGSRARTETPEAGSKEPGPAGSVADAGGEAGRPAVEEAQHPAGATAPARPDQAGGGEKDDAPGRAAFGLRDAPQAPGPSGDAAGRTQVGLAAPKTPERPERPAGAQPESRSDADEPAKLSRRSVEADFAFLDGGDEQPSAASKGSPAVEAASAGREEEPPNVAGGGSEPAAGPAGAGRSPSSAPDRNEQAPAVAPPGAPPGAAGPEAASAQQRSVPEPPRSMPAAEATPEREAPEQKNLPQSASPEAGGEPAAAAPAGPVTDPARSEPAAALPAAGRPAEPGQPVAPAGEDATGPVGPAMRLTQDGPQQPTGPAVVGHGPGAVPSASLAAARVEVAAAPLSGFKPGRGTTLGDLAERLEEVLIQKAATGTGADVGAPGGVQAVPPSPASPQPNEPSGAGPAALPHSGPHPGQPLPPPDPEADEAAIIDFSARRKSSDDSLEEEMARLLGELTRDTNRG
jgi:flagellar protein FliO/FliZ